MKRIFVILTLLAAPAFAQTADDADVAAMVAAIEEAGCLVTADNGDAILEASGLAEEQTMDVIAALYVDGKVALTEEGNMALLTEACQ